MTMLRWTFHDEDAPDDGSLVDWSFPVNPSKMDAPEMLDQVSAEPVSVDGTNRDTVQPTPPSSWGFEGILYTLLDLDAMEAWLDHGRPIHVTDHLGQTWRIQLVSVEATRNGSHNFPERHKYSATALMLGKVPA